MNNSPFHIDATSLRGRLLRLHGHRLFEAVVIAVILLSALMIGANTFNLPGWWLGVLSWMDTAVTLFFVLEISVRFLAEENKRRFFANGWNVFDTLIVTVSLVPIPESELALLGRLFRVFRVLRLISVMPRLRVLVNSLILALPQLGYVLLLMFIIFYIYGAIGTTLFHEINSGLWGDIGISMLTLFRVMTFEDWTDIMYETMEVYPLSWIYYISFIFLTAFAFLNMMIGIVVNVLQAEHARQERENE